MLLKRCSPMRVEMDLTEFNTCSWLMFIEWVLMAIWDCFKAAGISIPYPQRDLYVRSWPGAVSDAPPTAPIAALAAAPAGRP